MNKKEFNAAVKKADSCFVHVNLSSDDGRYVKVTKAEMLYTSEKWFEQEWNTTIDAELREHHRPGCNGIFWQLYIG